MKILTKISLIAACLFAITPVIAQPTLVEKVEAVDGKMVIPYEKWQLPNGLTILLHEDHSDPLVHVEVTYHVGSARETPGMSGFAHFFEHMMFQGSDHVADEEHFEIVSRAGGTMNGTTNRDRTNYFETVPSNYLETALWLEADRMGFLLDAVTTKKFENQRSTVKNEKDQNYLNVPYGTVGEVNDQNLYGPGHPYSWPTIGYTDDLDSSTVDDLKNFFLKWYGPNNAILTIAGDFSPERALGWVNKYFGSIPSGPAVKRMRLDRPILASDVYGTIEDKIGLPLIQFVFPSVPRHHRDEAALDMLASIMGGDNNSIFYKNFVKNEKAQQVQVYNICFELAGEFTIAVYAYPTEETKDIDTDIRNTIDQFEKEVLSASDINEQLQRAKANMKSSLVSSLASVQGKASSLTEWEMLMPGRKFNIDQDIARYEAVSKEDLVAVFNKYIKNKKAAITYVIPEPFDPDKKPGDTTGKRSFNPYTHLNITQAEKDELFKGLAYNKAKDEFDRSKQPAPSPAIPAVVPKYYKETFANGMKVIGTKFDEFPMVAILLEIKGGHLLEEDMNHGVGSITASMMNEATQNYTTEEMTAALASLGSVINVNSGTNSTSIYVQTMTENLDATLKLLEERLLRPKFTEEDFKRIKKQTLQSITNQENNASLTASIAYQNLLYGNTIMGSFFTGTYKSADKVDLDEVKDYYNMAYSPSVSNLVIVGPIGKDEVLPKLEFLKKWKAKEVKIPTISNLPDYDGTQVFLIDKVGAEQSQLRIGHLSNDFDYNGVYFKSNVMNFAFGGAFNSRLNLNLREDKGWTYGIRSGFSATKDYEGAFTIGAGVKTKKTDSSIMEIMKEVAEYKTNGITDEELKFTKSSILQRNVLNYESPFQKANFLSNILEYNLPDTYIQEQQDIVSSMTKEDVNKLAKDQLRPDDMVILVVGNSYLIKDKLENLGYGKVKELDVKNINLKEFKK